MDRFLKMPLTERRLACIQVEDRMRLQAASVEEDFWLCWILRGLFTLPEIGSHLIFKGGTSLSKAWKLIERFSEDIDLLVDKQTLGFGGDATPDQAPRKNRASFASKHSWMPAAAGCRNLCNLANRYELRRRRC